MSKFTFFLLLIVAIPIQGTITSIPVVLDVLLVFYILKRKAQLFILALISGIILDVFSVRILGLTSIFFIVFIFLVFLYERKFEIASYAFVFFSSLLGGLIYLVIFKYDPIFEQAVVSSIISVLLFKGSMYFNRISNLKSQISKLHL